MNIAIDTETYYSKTYSIRDLGNWAYVNHPEFNCYMLTAAYEDGRKWAGHPRDFEWESLNGHTMIMHNAGFDTAVLTRLCELGVARSFEVMEIFDTADMAAYLGYPRSLASASSGLLGIKMDKTTRDKMKGQQWDDMTGEMQTEVLEYATGDVVQTLALFVKHGHRWPQDEREISRITREMCTTGFPTAVPRVKKAIGQLEILLAKVRGQIPWAAHDPEAKPLSPKAVKIECEKNGITPPTSMAKDSEEFDAWLKTNGDLMPWARAMSQYRSINMFLKKLHTIVIRSHEDSPSVYVMPYSLKYCGAHTLRDSGDAGFNPQNLSRDPMFGPELAAAEIADSAGIDMRGFIEAPPGFQLAVVDLSAIEPCSLAVLSGDWELVDMLEGGMDPYEAQARIDGEYDGSEPLKDVNKGLRQYNKVKVLGCFAVDTLILTDRGYIPAHAIDANKSGLRLWDGKDWVTHEGYLDKGRQRTIPIRGERLTPDHKIFTSETDSTPAGSLCSRAAGSQLPWRPTPGTDWQDVRRLARGVLRALAQEWVSCSRSLLHKLRKHLSSRKLGQFTNRQVPRMRGVRAQAGFKNPNSTGMGARN